MDPSILVTNCYEIYKFAFFFLTKSKNRHCADSSKKDNRELVTYTYLKIALNFL